MRNSCLACRAQRDRWFRPFPRSYEHDRM